jgi:hypothetical protein
MDDMIKIEKDMTAKLIGETYMKYPTEISSRKYRYGLFECQYCNKEFEAQSNNIKHGLKSCGCLKGGNTHGLSHNQFYKTWKNMMGRCYNLKNKRYQSYGGRGISVCTDWQDLANFVSWAESTYIEGMTMDRINNDGNYEPTNIRWADKTTQAVNQRIQKNNTSGFVGINWYKITSKWVSKIKVNKVDINLGYFNSKEEAVQARDNYIIENNLPHKLSTDYKKEN